MEVCSNPYTIVLRSLDGRTAASSSNFTDMIANASVSELLERLHADCFEVRFEA